MTVTQQRTSGGGLGTLCRSSLPKTTRRASTLLLSAQEGAAASPPSMTLKNECIDPAHTGFDSLSQNLAAQELDDWTFGFQRYVCPHCALWQTEGCCLTATSTRNWFCLCLAPRQCIHIWFCWQPDKEAYAVFAESEKKITKDQAREVYVAVMERGLDRPAIDRRIKEQKES